MAPRPRPPHFRASAFPKPVPAAFLPGEPSLPSRFKISSSFRSIRRAPLRDWPNYGNVESHIVFSHAHEKQLPLSPYAVFRYI
jgi:hypothetical protein